MGPIDGFLLKDFLSLPPPQDDEVDLINDILSGDTSVTAIVDSHGEDTIERTFEFLKEVRSYAGKKKRFIHFRAELDELLLKFKTIMYALDNNLLETDEEFGTYTDVDVLDGTKSVSVPVDVESANCSGAGNMHGWG